MKFNPVRRASKRARAVVLSAMAGAVALSLTPSAALADWLKAESRRFIVYSNGSERDLRSIVTELERFDTTLRMFMNRDQDAETYRKLPVYVLSGNDMRFLLNDNRPQIAGFYMVTDEDIFAVAAREDEGFHTLKHEYAHHFMKSEFNSAYPAWFVEGFAEFYAPTEFTSSAIHVGKPNSNRAQTLFHVRWMPLTQVLTTRPFEVKQNRESYYPLSWLLTHWFLSDDERRGQLAQYMRLMSDGVDSVTALQQATGYTPAELTPVLRRYLRGRLTYRGVRTRLPEPDMTITRLPDSANDLLLLGQKLKSGESEENRARTLQLVRTRAANHANDPMALTVLGHAELHNAQDADAAEAALNRALEVDPDYVEALQYMARVYMQRAEKTDDFDQAIQLRRVAQGYLGRAFAADDVNYITFSLLAQNRSYSPGYPSANDLETLALAYRLAPSMSGIAMNYAHALMAHDRHAEAVPIIQIVANNPHSPPPPYVLEALREARRMTQEDVAAEEARIAEQTAAEEAATVDDEPDQP